MEAIKRMLRNRFDKLEWWQHEESRELILTAKSYGLNELAEEMKNDL
mgnify:FL=1